MIVTWFKRINSQLKYTLNYHWYTETAHLKLVFFFFSVHQNYYYIDELSEFVKKFWKRRLCHLTATQGTASWRDYQVWQELVSYLVKDILKRMRATRLQAKPQTDHQILIIEGFPERRAKITVCWGVKRNMGHMLSFRLKIPF